MFLARTSSRDTGQGVAQNIDGAESIHAELAPAGIEFGDLDQIRHEIVEAFCFLFRAMNHICLQGAQVSRETRGERVQAEPKLLQRLAEFFGRDAEKAGLEAIDILHLGDVLKHADSSQQLALGIAHGRGAQAITALSLAELHGQHGGFALSGDGLAHGDRIPHRAQNPLSARGVGQGHAIAGRFAQHFARLPG